MSGVVWLVGVGLAVGAGYLLRWVDTRDRISDLEAQVASWREAHRKLTDRALRAPLLPPVVPASRNQPVDVWAPPDPQDRTTGTFEKFDPPPLRPLDEVADGDGTEAPCVPPRASDVEATTVAPIPIGSSATPLERVRRELDRLGVVFGRTA